MITIFHIQIKTKFHWRANYYFGSIAAIYDHEINKEIDVSIHTLYKHNFDSYYENDKCLIFKSKLITKKEKVLQLELKS